MQLTHLSLQNFRSYAKAHFDFSSDLTVIVGPNTAGKTNLLEAITLLARGKTNRSEKDTQAVQFDAEIARIRGICHPDMQLEIVLTNGMVSGISSPLRRFLVNGVPKRRVDFASHLSVVSFAPADLDIVIGSPSLRRNFLDEALEQVDREYRIAMITYTKALRQRNALLDQAKESGRRNEKLFEYWDELLITYGQYITQKRAEFIAYINDAAKEISALQLAYDHSLISKERLLEYRNAEVGSRVTLVGPHRDELLIDMKLGGQMRNVKTFGSRGQQRLVILQLKMLQLSFIEEKNGARPLLLLDDIFSELDSGHIALVSGLLDKQQTIMTTTHKEFLDKKILEAAGVVELGVGLGNI